MGRFGELLFTDAVKAVQTKQGSRAAYARFEADDAGRQPLGPDEKAFLAERDSFYMASVGENGWPYVQHRGGPRGFVHVEGDDTLVVADYRGNRQYITVGNLDGDARVALIFVDYPSRQRLKVLGHVEVVEASDDPELARSLGRPGARVERVFRIHVEAFDWNCPQHITPRWTEEELAQVLDPVRAKLEALERDNARLRAELHARDAAPTG